MILDLPEVKLEGEDFLAIYTHRVTTQPGSEWEKQAFFGGKLLDLAITNHWLAKTDPSLSVEEIVAKLDTFLEDNDLLHHCIEKYELEKKLVRPESTPVGFQECRDFLCMNTAKLWNHGGMSAVQGWISALLQPGSVPPLIPQANPGARIEPLSMNGQRSASSESPASAPPMASTSATANGSDPLNFVTLQIFNEHALQKKKHNVSWQATCSGGAHCLLWTAQCSLDGQVRGIGEGPSKKIAQERAAREVWRAMGWSLVPSDPSSPPQSPLSSTTFAQSSDSSLPPVYSQGDAGLEWLTLSIFTQIVNQRRLSLEWRQEQRGEPHIPTWRLICILDGQEKGTGTGNTTKEAKLIAARDAWKNMGWSMTPT